MKVPPATPCRRHAAFTLVELLVGMVLASMVMAWVSLSAIGLQRSYEAANYQMTAQNDQLRVLDYLSRDLRMASVVNVLNGGTKVSLTLPAASPAPASLNLGPVLTSLFGAPPAAPATSTVAYYVEGGQLIREANGVQTVLADTVNDLEFTRQGSSMTTDILFTPRFSSSPTLDNQQSTRASNCTFLRNATPAS